MNRPEDRRPYEVLFLSTRNAVRSIMAEAIMNNAGRGRFHAQSAGAVPGPEVHPAALALLRSSRIPTEGLRPKSWDGFAAQAVDRLDFVIVVDEDLEGEALPAWPGRPMVAHWRIDDPLIGVATGTAGRVAECARFLGTRIGLFLTLPRESIERLVKAKV